jgi:hypothetical protein
MRSERQRDAFARAQSIRHAAMAAHQKRVRREVWAAVSQRAAGSGLAEMTVRELARALCLSHGAVQRALADLDAGGVIALPAPGRRRHVRPAGVIRVLVPFGVVGG